MVRVFRILLFVLGMAAALPLFAQTAGEFQAILTQNPILPEKASRSLFTIYPSEIKTLILAGLRAYQVFVATQDMSVCNFTPSCSHFAQEAFQRLSPFQALLLASDRLLRDNPSVGGQYPVDPQTGRYSDPLDFYLKLLKTPAKHAKATKRIK